MLFMFGGLSCPDPAVPMIDCNYLSVTYLPVSKTGNGSYATKDFVLAVLSEAALIKAL